VSPRLIGQEVGFEMAGRGPVRGIVQTFRQLRENRFAVTALSGNEILSGVVDLTPRGEVAAIVDDATADGIAHAVLDGRNLHTGIGRQMHALAAAWLSWRGGQP
jgi:hypothetical protein